ncbi:hypothetical protein Tco_1288255, partial [Tanacetum coccineum]
GPPQMNFHCISCSLAGIELTIVLIESFKSPVAFCALGGEPSAMKVFNWGGHLHFREVEE